jgi:hypothetical protein
VLSGTLPVACFLCGAGVAVFAKLHI